MPGVAPYTIALGPAVNISCGSSVTAHARDHLSQPQQSFTSLNHQTEKFFLDSSLHAQSGAKPGASANCQLKRFHYTLTLLLVISPNADHFQNYFTVKTNQKFVIKSSLKITPHLKRVATLPCEISGTFLNCSSH